MRSDVCNTARNVFRTTLVAYYVVVVAVLTNHLTRISNVYRRNSSAGGDEDNIHYVSATRACDKYLSRGVSSCIGGDL